MAELLERAVADAHALAEGGCHALIIENYGDSPFFGERVPPETVAAMAVAVDALRRALPAVPLGVNVLRNDARAALALCASSGASFLRVNIHTGAAVTDQGILHGRAAETLRERARLAPGVAILADVHVKHATPLGDQPIGEAAREALDRGLADAVIVTGRATGEPPRRADLEAVREAIGPRTLLVGSGASEEEIEGWLEIADGAIVGSAFEQDGRAGQSVEIERVRRLARHFRA
jgi:membrane complex biogenesis BtpA family protein